MSTIMFKQIELAFNAPPGAGKGSLSVLIENFCLSLGLKVEKDKAKEYSLIISGEI